MPMWVFQLTVIFLLVVIVVALKDIRNEVRKLNDRNDDS
jgi:hypothetical protein